MGSFAGAYGNDVLNLCIIIFLAILFLLFHDFLFRDFGLVVLTVGCDYPVVYCMVSAVLRCLVSCWFRAFDFFD